MTVPPWRLLSARHDLVRRPPHKGITCPITGARNYADARRFLFKRWRNAQKCPDLREIHTREGAQ